MQKHILLKMLTSIPLLLVFLYFLPFLGICFVLLRLLIYSNKRRRSTPIILISIGMMIQIPKVADLIFNLINFEKSSIPYFDSILNTQFYNINLLNYSQFLILTGIIILIILSLLNNIWNKIENNLKSYMINQSKIDSEISQKNDLIMKQKQENAKNTNIVYCPYCGADNMLTSNIGTCKYCRRKIQIKK